jgi:hypothetical protein
MSQPECLQRVDSGHSHQISVRAKRLVHQRSERRANILISGNILPCTRNCDQFRQATVTLNQLRC